MNSSKTVPKVEPARHWINGEWVGSSSVAESVSPSTGQVLGQYSAGGRVEAATSIAAPRKAFDTGGLVADPPPPPPAALPPPANTALRPQPLSAPISPRH